MALSVFDNKARRPTNADLARALKGSFVLWNELKERIASKFVPLDFEWGFSSKSTGWGLRLKHRDRTVLYMTPCEGHFLASCALGEKAGRAAHEANLPTSVLKIIDSAKKYAEGRGVRLKVTTASDLRHVERIAMIKMSS